MLDFLITRVLFNTQFNYTQLVYMYVCISIYMFVRVYVYYKLFF